MNFLERLLVDIALLFSSPEGLNSFFRDPQNTAILVGASIAIAGGILGTFLLLRGMSLTSDAISHTVLLGIVVAFLVITGISGQEPDLSSPWLILGAAAAGVATTVLTELIYKSGLVKQDAALGLIFPLLFALSIIMVSRFVDDVHLDEDSVMVGEIGVAWANTNSHTLSGSEELLIIDESSPLVEYRFECSNCQELNIGPRDPQAEFIRVASNLGTYSPSEAYRLGYREEPLVQVFWPKALSSSLLMMVLTIILTLVFFKELKVTSFDPGLAASLGIRPSLYHYGLMVMVSLVAVGAFDAVGSILVIAFFIIPPATAYILTEKVSVMLVISGLLGVGASVLGYQLAVWWNSSISASMVIALFGFLLIAWFFSPRYGLVSAHRRRVSDKRRFDELVLLGHVRNHMGTSRQVEELRIATMSSHVQWDQDRIERVCERMNRKGWVIQSDGVLLLTDLGEAVIDDFRIGLEKKRRS